ncbi:MAG TPA: LPS assembly lipoprotein LptE [Gammaproteobacteria bacterium]|nr:LPS assembly lipoprotein LptE [Gammaproteobacteria bacterium]
MRVTYFITILAISLLFGCGFHLRGTHILDQTQLPFRIVTIEPYAPEDRLQQDLALRLESYAVEIAKEPTPWILQWEPLLLETSPIAFGPNGELVREKLRLTLRYRLKHDNSVVAEKTLWTERQHHLNVGSQLATQEERNAILKEMQTDLLAQMVLQLSKIQYANNL